MNLTERILQDGELREKPPVLFDIGASTHLPEAWRTLAKYATCVAFDPDARQMGHLETASRDYRKLLVYPAIVHAEIDGEVDFYLTRSPECSSTLPPDTDSLRCWRFAPFFEVEKVVKLPAVTLKTVLRETGLDRIDACKSDTQGTDLRLFRSLPPELGRRILSLEFEPGIIDAYRGEDKLWQLLAAMEKEDDFYDPSRQCVSAVRPGGEAIPLRVRPVTIAGNPPPEPKAARRAFREFMRSKRILYGSEAL